MGEKRLLAILGSPHKNGKVASMLRLAMDCAKEKGYKITLVNLYDLSAGYCKGCMSCRKTGRCVLEDDMCGLGEQMEKSDVIILAYPTYFANVPAVVKNMFDRLSGTVMKENDKGQLQPRMKQEKKYALLVSCNTPAPFHILFRQSSRAVSASKEFFKMAGFKQLGNVVMPNGRKLKEISGPVRKKIGGLLQ